MDQLHPQAKHYAVCHDPTHQFAAGALVAPEEAALLAARGVGVLPVDAALVSYGGAVDGFFMRCWGSGWPLDSAAPRMLCPMLIGVSEESTELHWRALLVPMQDELPPWSGLLRVSYDTRQPGLPAGLTATDSGVAELPNEQQPGGGWLVGGRLRLSVGGRGNVPLALYGGSPGYAVAWAALSVL